jgi:hypothetical protein
MRLNERQNPEDPVSVAADGGRQKLPHKMGNAVKTGQTGEGQVDVAHPQGSVPLEPADRELNRQPDKGGHSELPLVPHNQLRQLLPTNARNQPPDGDGTERGFEK